MLSVKRAAAHAEVCESVIRGWLKEGLPHFRFGTKGRRGKIVISEADLDAWTAQFKVVLQGRGPKPAMASPPAKSTFKHLRVS